MKIMIVTRNRPHKQITYEHLAGAGLKPILILSNDDSNDYSHMNCEKIYVEAANIGEKRQRALELFKGKIIMLDDDLKFRRRDPENPKKFHRAGPDDIKWIFERLEERLSVYAHVGLTDEFMCQHKPVGGMEGGRYNQVLCYNTHYFPSPAPRFRININEEHDFNLQLQAAGKVPFIFCDATKSAGKYNAEGGLSDWRNGERERAEHQKFADLWPDLVSIKPCKNQVSGVRVVTKWKKALKK